jgi:hypothetical protein
MLYSFNSHIITRGHGLTIESEGFRASPDEVFVFDLVAELFGRVRVKEGEVSLVDPVPKDLAVDLLLGDLTEEVAVGALETVSVAIRVIGELRHSV